MSSGGRIPEDNLPHIEGDAAVAGAMAADSDWGETGEDDDMDFELADSESEENEYHDIEEQLEDSEGDNDDGQFHGSQLSQCKLV